jgi:alkylation response protein AidB-like acyl-CoA dehydrogenase
MSHETDTRTDASIAKGLFLGDIREGHIFPFPGLKAEERETVRMILESIDRFMAPKEKEFRQFDHEGVQPSEYIEELKALGLFSLIIPAEYDGLGLSNSAYSRVLQQTSRYDASTSLTIGAHSSIGLKALLLFGSDAQKTKYLPRLATGEMIAAFCLTESGSGSDAASIKTRATKNGDGSFTLNGEKIWITNGGTAEFFTVFAATDSDAGKITAFIVERSFSGVSSGPKEDKMGIRASCTTTVRFDDVRVPAECVLGEEGKGFKVAMAVLNNGRTGLGGGCVGAMKRLIELSIAQATARKQFGKSISEFQLIKEKIGSMAAICFAS